MIDEGNAEEHLVRNLVLSVCDLKQHGDTPQERLLGQAVTIGTRLYLHGGCAGNAEHDVHGDLHLLELEQMKWSLLPTQGDIPSITMSNEVSSPKTHHESVYLGHDSKLLSQTL